uniref:Sel1 repeat family protein n=1 Tax=Plectus sambesii TaxID=2011161 RepID=A0A914VFX0_9BILA
MYKDGRGVLQSDEEAIKWFTKSAEQGNANAHVSLWWMYDGQGVPQLDEEAVKWYRKTDRVFHNRIKKLSNGSEKLQNKAMQMLNIALDGCMEMGEARLDQMRKLSNGIQHQQNKEM